MRILKKRTGTDGYRTLRGLEEGEEVGYQGIRQLRMQEVLQYLFIAGIAQRYRIKVVIHHECIKDVGTEHHRLRNLHGGILILVELRMTLDDIVEESKAPTLTTQGSFSNAGKVGILIKLHSIKHGYHTQILHMTILHNRIKDNLSVSIYILKFLPGNVLQESRYREYGTGTKPAAHVIAADMIEHRIVGDVEDIILQLLQASDAHDFLVGFRISEDEIAKPHVLLHQTAQVHTHLLGVLVYKAEAFCFCLGTVITLRTLKDKGHKRVILSDIAEKLQTCIRTFLTTKGICAILWFDFLFNFISKSFGCTFQRESGITDDAKGIIGILIIQFLRLFISTSQYHLRTTTHTHGGSMPVQGFLGEVLTLL